MMNDVCWFVVCLLTANSMDETDISKSHPFRKRRIFFFLRKFFVPQPQDTVRYNKYKSGYLKDIESEMFIKYRTCYDSNFKVVYSLSDIEFAVFR